MKNFYKYICLLALSNFVIASSKSELKEASVERKHLFYNPQDRPNLAAQNPLKGFSKFIFFPMYPAGTKDLSEKIFDLVEIELKQFGQVNKSKLLVQTDKGEAIDLSVFATGATLIYKIENLTDFKGAELGIVRASLNLATAVEIKKTQQISSPYIWTSNCFLKGSTTQNLEGLVEQSLSILLKEFASNYSAVNPNRPVFELQGAE